MTKFKKSLFGFLGIYLFAALALAQAQNAPGAQDGSPKWHPGQHIQEIFSQLNLTDDQKKQLEANKQQHRAKMVATRQEMKTDREALRVELMKPQLDMPKITRVHNQIKALQSQMEDDKLSSILAVRAILTPEQYLKFVGLMQKHRPGHEDEHDRQ
jgi:Spy/CpxP family protein refolding chaperone